MSSPFLAAEPVQLTSDTVKNSEETPQEEQQPVEIKLPTELSPLLALYSNVIEDPRNMTFLWDFTQNFLTFLESKSNMIVPIIKDMYPHAKEENIILLIKEVSIPNIPWSIHNCFLTISNIGTNIAQKENKDDRDKYYLMYVMLSINNDSPTYSFTELLQTLQQQDNIFYNDLNKKFLDAFKKYESPSSDFDMKWVYIGIAIFIFILIISGGCYFYSCNNKNGDIVIDDVASIHSFTSITSG